MALNRGLYKSQGTNIVQHGTMSQRWLLGTVAGTVNTTTDEYGRAGDPTVGRGLLLTDTGGGVVFVAGKFNVTLQPGNSIADFVNAQAAVSKFNTAAPHVILSTQLKPTGVTFQTWSWTPAVTTDQPPVSVAGSVGALAALAGPYCATDGTLTTLGGIPVTVTSALTSQAVSGLTASVTFGASASVNATALVAGRGYTITTIGTTDFTLYGAASNTIGTRFVATGVGAGTGTCITQQITAAAITTPTADVLALLSPYGDAALATTWTLQLPVNLGGVSVTNTATPPAIISPAAVSPYVDAFATTLVTAPNPSWLSVQLEFTTSTVPA